jgi:regulator of sigma D
MAITQGIYTPADSPLFVQTSFGRMLMQFGRWKITNSMLVRRIVDGTYQEFKQKNYNGPNLHRLIKMFAVYAIGTYLTYEAGKAGYKTAKKVLSASTELFGTVANIIPNVLDVVTGNNPTQESLRALYFSYQELVAYIGLGAAPMGVKVQKGLEDSYIAAKANFDQLMGKNDATDAINQTKQENQQKVKDLRPTYDRVQNLKQQGKMEEAQKIVDGLSDDDYETYKKIKASEASKATLEKEKEMFPVVKQIQELKKQGHDDQAQAIVDKMSDEEYRIYGLAKKKLGY